MCTDANKYFIYETIYILLKLEDFQEFLMGTYTYKIISREPSVIDCKCCTEE